MTRRWTRRGWALWAGLGLVLSLQAAAQDRVRLSFRPVPGQQVETRTEGETQMQVSLLEDRGIGQKLAAQGGGLPMNVTLLERNRLQMVAGAAAVDGSFPVELAFVEKSTALRLPDGREQPLPDPAAMASARVAARMGPQGAVVPGSVQLQGGPADEAARAGLLGALTAVLEALAQLEDVEVGREAGTPQRLQMALPVPGVGGLQMDIQVMYRLLAVQDGVADVELIYTLGVNAPSAAIKLSMQGRGGGRMRYEPARRLVLEQSNQMALRMEIDGPDGRLGFQMNNRQRVVARRA